MNWKEQVEAAADKHADNFDDWFHIREAFILGATWEKQRAEIQAAALPKDEEQETDEFCERHLARIKQKMIDMEIERLIEAHLKWHPTELKMASAKYFTETGKISGSLYLAIYNLAIDFATFVNRQTMDILKNRRAALPVKKDESDLGNYEYFKKLKEHFKKNEVQLTPEEFKTLNDSFSKRLSKTPTRLDDQQVKEEGNPDAQ